IRIKPYYLYQADMTMGTDHFRTKIEKGLEIIRGLQGHTSGMGVPYFVIDTPGGGGKVRLLPDTVVEYNDREIMVRNFEGKVFRYPQPTEKSPKKNVPSVTVVSSPDKLCEMA
ncbi:MAG: lysine 2,3-aminomutase, partial [Nitrospinaceae bacterium]